MFIRVRPHTASAGTRGGAAQGFGLQQHVERVGQPFVVPAIGLGLEGLLAQEMHRRAQPPHHRLQALAPVDAFAHQGQALKMAHGAPEDLGHRSVRGP